MVFQSAVSYFTVKKKPGLSYFFQKIEMIMNILQYMEIKKMYLYELNFTFLKIIFLTSQTFYQNFCKLNYVIRVLFSIGHAALDRNPELGYNTLLLQMIPRRSL